MHTKEEGDRERRPNPFYSSVTRERFLFQKEIFRFSYRYDCNLFFFSFVQRYNDTENVWCISRLNDRGWYRSVGGVARFRARREINCRTIDRFLQRRDSRGCEPDTVLHVQQSCVQARRIGRQLLSNYRYRVSLDRFLRRADEPPRIKGRLSAIKIYANFTISLLQPGNDASRVCLATTGILPSPRGTWQFGRSSRHLAQVYRFGQMWNVKI